MWEGGWEEGREREVVGKRESNRKRVTERGREEWRERQVAREGRSEGETET